MEELKLFGEEYCLKQQIINDAYLRNNFKMLAKKTMKDFDPFYTEAVKNWKNLYDYGYGLWAKGIEYVADDIIKIFSAYEIYDITEEVLNSSIEDNSLFIKIFDEYCDLIEEIDEDQKKQDQYRRLRKESRTKFYGGGFGIGGAVKGAVKAGTINMVTGTAHDIVNIAGKGLSSADASSKRNKLFLEYRDKLPSALKYDIEVFLCNFVEKKLMAENACPFEPISNVSKAEAQIIFENLKKTQNNDELSCKMAYKLLCTDPSNTEYYIYLADRFPNERQNIVKLAMLLYLDVSEILKNELQGIINKYPCDNEENAKILKNELLKFMSKYDIKKLDYLDQVNEYLKQKDIEARTFNDVTYETRKQKQKASLDFEDLYSKCSKLEYKNEKQCRELKDEICKSEYNYTPQVKDEFIKKIDDRIDQIWSYEDRNILNSLLIGVQADSEQKKKECIEYIKERGRTQEKQKYIDAIEALTPENIKKAKKHLNHRTQSNFILYIWNWLSIIPVILCWSKAWWLGLVAGFIAIMFWGYMENKYKDEKNMWDLLTVGGIAVNPVLR